MILQFEFKVSRHLQDFQQACSPKDSLGTDLPRFEDGLLPHDIWHVLHGRCNVFRNGALLSACYIHLWKEPTTNHGSLGTSWKNDTALVLALQHAKTGIKVPNMINNLPARQEGGEDKICITRYEARQSPFPHPAFLPHYLSQEILHWMSEEWKRLTSADFFNIQNVLQLWWCGQQQAKVQGLSLSFNGGI